jgi:hypothetical protein
MADQTNGLRPSSDPSKRPAPASRLVRALYTHNPFYVISADLVFIGLRMSFDPSAKAFDTWALISSLAGYTLLLATTACLLVRYGKVWDDMRSVLLLVVMMFLAISSTIDDVLILRPGLGLALALGGLAFSLIVSEGLLRGMRLGLPALYRGPYYLILALFFLYPVALRQLLARPDSATSHWALFGFSTAAGLAFLTLLPAIRRGAAYLKGNGSPWRWPLYPWSLFFFLGLGVCGRAYYLCISLHNVEGYRSIFGPYFLVPFGFAVATLILEHGLVSGRQGVLRFALAIPLGLVALAMLGHRTDLVYEHFLTVFREGLGVSPVGATLILSTLFYGYAAWRTVPLASAFAMASLAGLSVVGPSTLSLDSLVRPNGWPLLPVALYQGWLALKRQESVRGVIAAVCFVTSVSSLLNHSWPAAPIFPIAVHLTIVAFLALGAIFQDEVGEHLRACGAFVMLGATVAICSGDKHLSEGIPPSWLTAYPYVVVIVALVYGRLVGGWPFYALSGSIAGGFLAMSGGRIYLILRQQFAGLDRIAWGLASFLVAAIISLWKAGVPQRWLAKGPPTEVLSQPSSDPPAP